MSNIYKSLANERHDIFPETYKALMNKCINYVTLDPGNYLQLSPYELFTHQPVVQNQVVVKVFKPLDQFQANSYYTRLI